MILTSFFILTFTIYKFVLKNYLSKEIRLIFATITSFVFNGVFVIPAHILQIELTDVVYLLFTLITTIILIIVTTLFNKNNTGSLRLSASGNLRLSSDLILIMSVLVSSLLVFYFHNKFGTEISFISMDPAGHFDMAWTFSKNRLLLIDQQSLLRDYSTYPVLFYVNSGLLLTLFDSLGIIKMIEAFNWFNWFIYVLIGLEVYFIIKIIDYKHIAVSVILLLLIMLCYPANILLTGFCSQMFAVLFFLGIVISVLIEDQYKLKNSLYNIHTFLQNIFLIGLFLSYHYYIPEILLSLFVFNIIKSNKPTMVQKIFFSILTLLKKYFIALLVILPLVKYYISSSTIINADGGITKDIYASFILFIPGLIQPGFFKQNNKYNFISILLLCTVLFSTALYLLCIFKISSPYYFFKNYLMLSILLGLNTLVFFKNETLKAYPVKVSAISFVILLLSLVSLKIRSDIIETGNNFIYYKNIEESRTLYNNAQMILVNNLIALNTKKENTCIIESDLMTLVWFDELTNGIYFRGLRKDKDPWTWGKQGRNQGWKDLYFDKKCKLPDYKFVIDYKCTRNDLSIVMQTDGGCIYKFKG